ncbi:MAG: MerR family transcriptional regulator [Candidatus Eremiobacteraeota bacterium]|nr:MerR family transcriptional regulator [Candidatus Eremiobacteraeota bacterium]
MQRKTDELYQAGEFAQLAGVTVRTLHHYDELGLLKPAAYTPAGYRLYAPSDLARLQQIAALRFIGMPLKEIKATLSDEHLSLAATLVLQHRIMVQKRAQIDTAIDAIERAQVAVRRDDGGQWVALREVIQRMDEQQQWDWAKAHYTQEQLERLGKRYDPAMQTTYTQQWSDVIAQVEAEKDADPASPQAQALAKRWADLISAFTNDEPDIEKSLHSLYADAASQPKGFKNPLSPQAGTFIYKAIDILERPYLSRP